MGAHCHIHYNKFELIPDNFLDASTDGDAHSSSAAMMNA
jgi:hypothetical protein